MEELVQEILDRRLVVHCPTLDLRHQVIDAIVPFLPANADLYYVSDTYEADEYPYMVHGSIAPLALCGVMPRENTVMEAKDFLTYVEQEPSVTGLEALL